MRSNRQLTYMASDNQYGYIPVIGPDGYVSFEWSCGNVKSSFYYQNISLIYIYSIV